MIKRKETKGQTTIYKTTQKTKDWATRTILKPSVKSGAPEGRAVPAPRVVPVVLLLLQTL